MFGILISASFAKNDLQLKASFGSSPPCTEIGSRTKSGMNIKEVSEGAAKSKAVL